METTGGNIFIFLRFCLFLDRGEGREGERERNINVRYPLMCPLLGAWPITQACALTGNRTSNPLVRRPELKPLSHTSQGMGGNVFKQCRLSFNIYQAPVCTSTQDSSVLTLESADITWAVITGFWKGQGPWRY